MTSFISIASNVPSMLRFGDIFHVEGIMYSENDNGINSELERTRKKTHGNDGR